MMQVVARYMKDRSVVYGGKSNRNVIKLVLMCLDDGAVLRAETKKDVSWRTCSQRLWVHQLVRTRFSLVRCR